MAQGLDQFAAHLREIESRLGEFKAVPYYEPDTDSLIYYIRDESSYGKRVTRFITLHLSNADDTLVGIEVKGLRTITKAIEGMNSDIDIVEPMCVKGEDGGSYDLAVVVRQALVPHSAADVTGDEYEKISNATRGIKINKKEVCQA